MIFEPTLLERAHLIKPEPFTDQRGFFSRTFCEREFKAHGLRTTMVQTNHSGTQKKGTIRGLHFQRPPHTEAKLIKCIKGSIYDVIVDVRADSPTFLKYFGTTLSAENQHMLYVPDGFAHGFQTLEDNIEVLYQVSEFYSPECEGGIRYNDPAVGVEWKFSEVIVSEKDSMIPLIGPSFEGIEL